MYSLIIADDNSIERKYLRDFLMLHYPTNFLIAGEANNGWEVLNLVKEKKCDVVLLDIRMPKLDGLETARQLLNMTPDVTIVFVTSHADFSYARTAIQLGIKAYILKPYLDKEL